MYKNGNLGVYDDQICHFLEKGAEVRELSYLWLINYTCKKKNLLGDWKNINAAT